MQGFAESSKINILSDLWVCIFPHLPGDPVVRLYGVADLLL